MQRDRNIILRFSESILCDEIKNTTLSIEDALIYFISMGLVFSVLLLRIAILGFRTVNLSNSLSLR